MNPRMADKITAGSIWVLDGGHLPPSLRLQSHSRPDGWVGVEGDRLSFEKAAQNAGWTLFFMAGEIEVNVLGSDPEKADRAAFERLIARVRSQQCNCIEITRMRRRSFLGVPYVTVSAHVRHLQKGFRFFATEADSVRVQCSQMAQADWKVTAS
jgi:hypothetical protein